MTIDAISRIPGVDYTGEGMSRLQVMEDHQTYLGEYPKIPNSVIKSAGRVLQILEYFDDIQRRAGVHEICTASSYPQSSTSMMLRSMVAMGYLHYSRFDRTYLPTSRVSLLGSWLDRSVVKQGYLHHLLERLNAKTGNLVVLAARNQLHAHYIHILQPTSEPSAH